MSAAKIHPKPQPGLDAPTEHLRKLRQARHDINTNLATLNLCIEFLAESSGKLGQGAVEDSRLALRRIAEVVAGLHADAESANPQLSGVVER
jgi:hypothetical protein